MAALHVFNYLKGTLEDDQFYYAQSQLQVSAYSDSDWSACEFGTRSLSAYAVFLGNDLVSWNTKKQQTISKSTAKAEYRSMSATTSELVWIHGLLEDLKVHVPLSII